MAGSARVRALENVGYRQKPRNIDALAGGRGCGGLEHQLREKELEIRSQKGGRERTGVGKCVISSTVRPCALETRQMELRKLQRRHVTSSLHGQMSDRQPPHLARVGGGCCMLQGRMRGGTIVLVCPFLHAEGLVGAGAEYWYPFSNIVNWESRSHVLCLRIAATGASSPQPAQTVLTLVIAQKRVREDQKCAICIADYIYSTRMYTTRGV